MLSKVRHANLLCPLCVKHFKVLVDNSNFFFLVCLVKIFEDDGDVHVDDNHEVDDDKRDKVDNSHKWVATVSIG